MQVEIRPGLLYFFKDREDGRVRELLAGLRSAGYRIMTVSPPRTGTVKELDSPSDCVLTLTESVGQGCVDPQNLMVLTDTVTKFVEREGRSALLVEDLGLLKQKNEFPKVLRFMGFIYESLAMNRGIGIIMLDPRSFDPKEIAHLGKEGFMVEEKDRLDTKSVVVQNP
jgi:hypothetical protein